MSEVLDPKVAVPGADGAGAATAPPPEALAAPVKPVSLGFQLMLGFAGLGIWLTTDPVVALLIPTQVQRMAPDDQAATLALVSTLGALVALVTNVLVGALSDRTTSRLGRRRPWIMAGALVTAVALGLASVSTGVVALALAWMLAQFGSYTVISTTGAVIPDRVPDRQKGLASALYGLAVPVALLLGAVLLGGVVPGVTAGYLVLVALMLVLVAPFALTQREPVLPPGVLPPTPLWRVAASLWGDLRRDRDFLIAWVTRFLVIFGYAFSAATFLFLYVQKALDYESLFPGHEVREGVGILLGITTLVEIPTAIVAATLSDRLQRRKPFVIASSIGIAAGLALIGLVQTWPAAQVAAVIVGIGFGAYIAVDSALLAQVLPSTRNRARDLGVLNVSNLVPGILAPLAGAAVIGAFGEDSPLAYRVLFLVAGALTLVSAVLIRFIRGVR